MSDRFGILRRLLLASCMLVALGLFTGCGNGDEQQEQEQRQRSNADAGSTEHIAREGTSALPVVYPAGPAAPKPTGPLPANTSCVTAECHADLTRAAHVHGPVAKQDCSSCHGEDTGQHAFPLKRQGDATCTFCHTVSGTQTHQHKALEQGCQTCHKPHTSQTKFLLTAASTGQLCGSCHTLPVLRFAHDAFAKGNCTDCHWPHQSDNAKLVRGGEGRENCLSCHKEMRDSMGKAQFVHEPARGDCGQCHQAHSSDYAHLMSSNTADSCLSCHKDVAKHMETAPLKHGAMLSDRQCSNCHTAHASAESALIRDRMDKVCLTCHDRPLRALDGHQVPNMKPVLTESKYLHGPVKNGSCSGCHDSHGSKYASLLEQAFPDAFYTSFELEKYELCFKCHDPKMVQEEKTQLTGFRDGETNLHFVHVNRQEKGRSCRTCHDMHGSNLPGHMAGEVPFEGSAWAMPIEFEQLPEGGSCAPGCHARETYKRTAAPATRGAE